MRDFGYILSFLLLSGTLSHSNLRQYQTKKSSKDSQIGIDSESNTRNEQAAVIKQEPGIRRREVTVGRNGIDHVPTLEDRSSSSITTHGGSSSSSAAGNVETTIQRKELTSMDQLGITIDILAFDENELQTLFEDNEFVGFIHFPPSPPERIVVVGNNDGNGGDNDGNDDNNNNIHQHHNHVDGGAVAILTTRCEMTSSGQKGAVYCAITGGGGGGEGEGGGHPHRLHSKEEERCVSFEFLRHPQLPGRAGYCHNFLPLSPSSSSSSEEPSSSSSSIQAQIAASDPSFAIALYQTCLGKDDNCLYRV